MKPLGLKSLSWRLTSQLAAPDPDGKTRLGRQIFFYTFWSVSGAMIGQPRSQGFSLFPIQKGGIPSGWEKREKPWERGCFRSEYEYEIEYEYEFQISNLSNP